MAQAYATHLVIKKGISRRGNLGSRKKVSRDVGVSDRYQSLYILPNVCLRICSSYVRAADLEMGGSQDVFKTSLEMCLEMAFEMCSKCRLLS